MVKMVMCLQRGERSRPWRLDRKSATFCLSSRIHHQQSTTLGKASFLKSPIHPLEKCSRALNFCRTHALPEDELVWPGALHCVINIY